LEIRFLIRPKNDGPVREARCEFEDRVTIGRSPESPVQFDDPAGISRDHFALERNGRQLEIIDFSSNGTWVAGRRLPREQPCPIRAAEAIDVPGYRLEIYFEAEAEAAPVAKTATAVGEPAPRRSWLYRFAGSLSGFEKFLITAALGSLGLVLYYVLS
jgi:predicted component of type VI protein secretion system